MQSRGPGAADSIAGAIMMRVHMQALRTPSIPVLIVFDEFPASLRGIRAWDAPDWGVTPGVLAMTLFLLYLLNHPPYAGREAPARFTCMCPGPSA
jgi:hypothetical protein